MMTFLPLIKKVNGLEASEKVKIFKSLDLKDWLNVLKLPGGHIMLFSDELNINLHENESYNILPIKLTSMADNPYCTLDDFENLNKMQTGLLRK
jgi:hypothetical protein